VEAEGAVADQADLGVEALEAAVGEAEADGGEDAVAVRAERAREPDERSEPRARCPGQPGVEVRGRERRVVEVVLKWPSSDGQAAAARVTNRSPS
jgi:hypothetical protein